jgi:hypothetical protein
MNEAQLAFFKNAGERFARNRDKGLRYGEIMQDYPPAGGLVDEMEEPARFMPFAGTEGYSPVAYAPHILRQRSEPFSSRFSGTSLMRVLGLIALTMVSGTPSRSLRRWKWAFVLIAMFPVSLYNRSVLTGLMEMRYSGARSHCPFASAPSSPYGHLGTLAVDDGLRAHQATADRFVLLELMSH